MKFFKQGSMMQEHRQHIKRANAEAEDSWINALELCAILNEVI
jgi:hypothetical protein